MSTNTEIVDDLEERKKIQNIIKLFLLISIGAALFYFSYLFNPNNIDNPILYIVLIFVEIYIFIQCVGTWYTLLLSPTNDETQNPSFQLIQKNLKLKNKIDGGVSVLVTVCGEPLDIVEKTLQGVIDMKIAHDTYLVDDLGKQPSKINEPYKSLALRLGAKYLKTVENKQYKVGGLNFALDRIDSKFVANFDSDFVPKKNFLLNTLPYFHDKKLAWVQTPQAFRNTNNLISQGAADSVNAFYSDIMPGKNAFNSAIYVGTNAIFRREALQSIKGYQVHISEDLYTAFNLHQAGWKSIAISEKLAYGLAPDNVNALFKQILRWSGGTLEIFFHEKLFKRKLTIDQKFQYFVSATYYFYGLVVLAMILFPITYLLFQAKPLASLYNSDWAMHYLPYFIFQFVTITLFASKLSLPAVLVSMNLYPVTIKGLLNAIKRNHSKWVVTNIGKVSPWGILQKVNILYWHYLIVFISVISIIIGITNIKESLTTAISVFWVSLNVIITLVFIYFSHKSLRNENVR